MRRLLRNIPTYNYLQNHKKPIAQMPSSKPPKYVYQVKYHPDWKPTLDQGFKDHRHSPLFLAKAYTDFENFRYQYTGQQWQKGPIFAKFLVIMFPFLAYAYIIVYDQDNVKNGLPSIITTKKSVDVIFKNCIPHYEL